MAKPKEKPGVMIYFETAKAIKGLDYETKGRLFEAIMEYAEFGTVPDFDGVLSAIWPFVADKVERDGIKYEKIRRARAEAGRNGGLARANNMKQNQVNEANAISDKQIKPTASASPTATATASEASASTTEIREKGNAEMDKGQTFTSLPQSFLAEPSEPDPDFDALKRSKLEYFDAAMKERNSNDLRSIQQNLRVDS